MPTEELWSLSCEYFQEKPEWLEHLRSEDSPRRPMITHTIDQFILDPKSKQDKVKVTNLKNFPKLQIFEIWKTKKNLHATQLLNLLDKV